MRSSAYLLMVIIFLLSVSCRKDPVEPVYERVEPLCYLPVYPGSWWKYEADTGGVITEYTSSTYEQHHYYTYNSNEDCAQIVTNCFCVTNNTLVPKWRGMAIYGYDAVAPDFHNTCFTGPDLGSMRSKYIDTTIGQWEISRTEYSVWGRRVVNADTTIVVNGVTYNNVVVMQQGSGPPSGVVGWPTTQYFACGVGLIREDLTYPDTVSLSLLDYHINN